MTEHASITTAPSSGSISRPFSRIVELPVFEPIDQCPEGRDALGVTAMGGISFDR
jgi:hypothetical protein